MQENEINSQSVNAMVGRFYHCALNVPLEKFRETLLHDIQSLMPFDGALWGTCDADARQFHSFACTGSLDRDYADVLANTRLLNPMYEFLLTHPDTPVVMSDLVDDETFYVSEAYSEICQPYGVERALGTSCRDPRNRAYNLVVFLRSERAHKFSDDEKRIQKHLVFHMMNAVSLAYSVYLSQVSSEQGGSSAAICDQQGICYDTQPMFMNLVAKRFPKWQGDRLPFDLAEVLDNGKDQLEGLLVSASSVGDLLCIQIREESPMDMLTNREREIVTSVCRGLSYKEVAKPLGIAPSTVSNHIYRVFEKLGVTSRTELAKLYNRARHLH